MSLRSVEQQWEGFAAKVFTGFEPSKVQRDEMRAAFYAGVWSLLCTIKTLANPSIAKSQAIDHLESISVECQDFMNQLLSDHAQSQ
jgi:phosphopantetheinyl transferase (holo-ACP synthase)